MVLLKSSASGVGHASCTRRSIDEEAYRAVVLRSPLDVTEDELDHRLELEARVVGVQCRPPHVDPLTSSTSAATIASDFEKPRSAISQSTDPTSCSSSERRHTFQSPDIHLLPISPTRSVTPSLYSYTEKTTSAVRNGLRRMSIFRKRSPRRSSAAVTPASIEQGGNGVGAADQGSRKESLESPLSTTSRKSSWSTSIPLMTKDTVGESSSDDKEAIRRTQQCVELQELQIQQRDERDRFLEFQRKCLSDMRSDYEKSKKQKIEAQTAINERSIADLESRQLEAEMKLMEELAAEKRTCVIRLRHMEAYCHSPSPPLTPTPDRHYLDSPYPTPLPHRKVTDKDFNNLAQQYRERDSMEDLHRSKIQVLRGRQEKSYSDYIAKKAREIRSLEAEHGEAIEKADGEAVAQEEVSNMAFVGKKYRLERRWRLEVGIEMAKQEKITGLKFAVSEDVMVGGKLSEGTSAF